MASYKLPSDPIAELILKMKYPSVKKEAKRLGKLNEVITAYRSAASDVDVSSESKSGFNREADLERCLAGLNAARKIIGWDEFKIKKII